LHVVTKSHGLTHDGARYFGLLQVANGTNPDGFGLVVGIRNSHDKTFPAGLVLGASIFICDNLSFSGEVRLARKHTAHIERDLPQLVDRAVGLLSDLRNTQERRFAAYRLKEITDGQAHDLIIQALDSRIVPVTKLPDVLTEWRSRVTRNSAKGERLGACSTLSLRFSRAISVSCQGGHRLCTDSSTHLAGW
jgi:hypothetical protein